MTQEEDKGNSPPTLVASRNELKVAKLEIESLYICEKIHRTIGAIVAVFA